MSTLTNSSKGKLKAIKELNDDIKDNDSSSKKDNSQETKKRNKLKGRSVSSRTRSPVSIPYYSDTENSKEDILHSKSSNRGSDKKKIHERRWTLSGQDETSKPITHNRRKSNSHSSSISHHEKPEVKPRSNKVYRSKAESEKMKKIQESLISWAKEMLDNNPNYNIQSINDFNDGVILLAILHKYDPTLIDFENFDKSNPVNNLETLFNIVEEKFNISNIFDPNLIINGANPSGLTLYISMMKKKMEMKNNTPNHNYIDELKLSLNQFKKFIQTNKEKIESDNKEVEALSCNDELYESKNKLKEKCKESENQIEKCMNFICQLDLQNKALREQNIFLQQKLSAIEDINKHDQQRKESVEKRLSFMNRLLSLSSLLSDNELENYLKTHEDKLKNSIAEKENADKNINP